MIAAEVEMQTFYFPTGVCPKIVMIHTGPMEEWCDANIGTRAEFRAQVSDDRPWICSYSHGVTTWHFASAESATWFKLRWS